jgi:hypothetical protein
MWRADEVCPREPRANVWACMGCQGKKHRGHPSPRQTTVRGDQKVRGQFPQIRAAGRTHTPRGELRFTCEYPQGGDDKSPNAFPLSSASLGVGGPFR